MRKQERATIMMPTHLKQRSRAQAILQGLDLSYVVRELLKLWLDGKIELPESSQDGAKQD